MSPIERYEKGQLVERSSWVPIVSVVSALSFGAVAFYGGIASGVIGGETGAKGTPPAPSYDPPNTPTVTATIYRSQADSMWVSGGVFVGSLDDTHDSTYIKVDSTGGGKNYHLDTIGAQERDSLGGNVTALDSGAVVDIIVQYKGTNGGWSPPDTTTGIPITFAQIEFVADWSYAIGDSVGAYTDDGRWSVQTTIDHSDVIASTGLDFPTDNVFRVQSDGDSEIINFTSITVPNVGESLYIRFYERHAAPEGSQSKTHPIQDGANIGSVNWGWRALRDDGTDPSTQFRQDWRLNPSGTGAGFDFGANFDIELNTTYRWELQIHRVHADSFQAHARVYNSADSLLWDDDDFPWRFNSGTLADSVSVPFNNVNNLAGIRAGLNGFSGVVGVQVYGYQGGFCVRADDWCGAYDSFVDESAWGR